MSHQLSPPSLGYVDKRRSYKNDDESHLVGATIFTANAAGTTNTIVGIDAVIGSGINVVRYGDEFKLFNTLGNLKEEKIFRVTGAASSTGTTTVTFTPPAAVATASGDTARLVGPMNMYSNAEMDRRLATLGFSANYISKMTENDKIYQIRTLDDPGSL